MPTDPIVCKGYGISVPLEHFWYYSHGIVTAAGEVKIHQCKNCQGIKVIRNFYPLDDQGKIISPVLEVEEFIV